MRKKTSIILFTCFILIVFSCLVHADTTDLTANDVILNKDGLKLVFKGLVSCRDNWVIEIETDNTSDQDFGYWVNDVQINGFNIVVTNGYCDIKKNESDIASKNYRNVISTEDLQSLNINNISSIDFSIIVCKENKWGEEIYNEPYHYNCNYELYANNTSTGDESKPTSDLKWKCSNCGTLNTTNYCGTCGIKKPGPEPAPDSTSATTMESILKPTPEPTSESTNNDSFPIVLFEQDNCTVYATGNIKVDGTKLLIDVLIDNKSDKERTIFDEYWSVNGWSVSMSYCYTVAPESKKKTQLSLSLEGIDDIITTNDVHEIKGKLHFQNTKNPNPSFGFNVVNGQIIPRVIDDTLTPKPTPEPTQTPTPEQTPDSKTTSEITNDYPITIITQRDITLRASETVQSAMTALIPAGKEIIINSVDEATGWASITYNGKTGYVKSKYVLPEDSTESSKTQKIEPTPEPTEPTPSPEPTSTPTSEPTPEPTAVLSAEQVYIPEIIVKTYNDSIEPFFKTLSGRDEVSSVKDFAEMQFRQTEKNAIAYSNKSETVFIFFGGTDRNAAADNMMIYCSLKDNNELKNIPELIAAEALSKLDSNVSFEEFGAWANDATDGSTYTCDSFDAYYKMVDNDFSQILIIRKAGNLITETGSIPESSTEPTPELTAEPTPESTPTPTPEPTKLSSEECKKIGEEYFKKNYAQIKKSDIFASGCTEDTIKGRECYNIFYFLYSQEMYSIFVDKATGEIVDVLYESP